MARYDVTYTCGHNDRIQLYGKHKDREWWLAREHEKLCPDCYRAKLEEDRRKQNEEAAAKNREKGLPELEGTEKQIPWAEALRGKFMQKAQEEIERINQIDAERIKIGMELAAQKASASWWIDTRFDSVGSIVGALIKEAEIERTTPPAEVVEANIQNAILRPTEAVTESVAIITPIDGKIWLDLPERNDRFREAVKAMGYKWNGRVWARNIVKRNGSIEDRAAEAGHRLLAEGFIVRIDDELVREKAISGEYQPEQTRWIFARIKDDYEGWFAVHWGRKDDLYGVAKRLPGSRWDRPFVVVPPEQFEQVLDFAETHGFSLTEKAQEVADQAMAAKEAALIVDVKPPKQTKLSTADTTPPVLEAPEEVLVDESLRDDD